MSGPYFPMTGASWQEPEHAPVAFPADTGASLGRVWQLTPAGADQPDVVWAGTEPSALFRSDDGGRSFALVRALWDHPHREQWGAGFGGQAVHIVLPHPRDPARMAVAMSTGGVYRSDDDGRTWTSIPAGLPSDFGFPVAAPPSRPGTVHAFPLVADGQRFPVDHRCRVYRSADAGDAGPLRGEAGGASRLTVGAAGTLRTVLDELAGSWPRLARRIRDERGELRRYVNVYVDGEDCRHVGGLVAGG